MNGQVKPVMKAPGSRAVNGQVKQLIEQHVTYADLGICLPYVRQSACLLSGSNAAFALVTSGQK